MSAERRKKPGKKPAKKRWEIYGTVTGGKYCGTIEADSKEEAEEIAWSNLSKQLDLDVDLCYRCSGQCENATITELNAEEEDGSIPGLSGSIIIIP